MLENLPDPSSVAPVATPVNVPDIPGSGGTGNIASNKTLWIAGAVVLGVCVYFYAKGKKNDPKV